MLILNNNTLDTHELTTLAALECQIDAGILTIGNALKQIKDQRLYRQNYGSFEQYCKTRWGKTRQWAYKQIGAAGVDPIMSTFVDNVEQAHVLSKVNPTLQDATAQLINDLLPSKKTAGAIKLVADVLRDALDTGFIEAGDDGQIKITDVHRVAVSEAVAEQHQRHLAHLQSARPDPIVDEMADADQIIALVSQHLPIDNQNYQIKIWKRKKGISITIDNVIR